MIEFRLPSLGADMDEGKLLEWRIAPGEAVRKGQVVAVVDTAKAAIDVECWHDGTVQALLTEPGTTIPVGTLMAVLREPGESAAEVERAIAALRAASAAPAPAPVPVAAAAAAPTPSAEAPAAAPVPTTVLAPAPPPMAPTVPTTPAATASEPTAAAPARRVSPAARKRAAELGIDPATIAAGRDGTVSLAEVERAAARAPAGSRPPASAAPSRAAAPTPAGRAAPARPAPPAAATPAAPATMAERAAQMRKVIGAAMARSKREIPHYYLAEDVLLTAAHAWLARENAARSVTERLLLAPLLLKGVAAALRRYPEFNGFYRGDAFEAADGIHIGVAISLRAGGLVTPALLDVDRKDIEQINRELLDLVRRTRAGSLKSTELSAGTITVTNLGEQGVASVFGVIYPPQVALVGFGRPTERPVAVDGGLRVAPVVSATLAADHRVSDGHRGGLFLAALRDLLQNPDQLTETAP